MEEELLQPVTYGSVIYLSTEASLHSYMFTDGFVDQNVKLLPFESICGSGKDYYDFSFCLFMVLPFSNIQSFEEQKRVITDWKGILLNSTEEKLEKRKEQIAQMTNKLESEFQFNLGIIQKSQNTSICFASSNFMLLHLNSLKFLTLIQDDNNNLFLQLTEHPDPSCFFNFDPSLKLQKGRSDNFVYEEEIVYISCAKRFSGKSPFLSILENDLIIGQIDSKENWKVNIYEEPHEESQYLRIGSAVWILSSEQQVYLSAQRNNDPFIEMYEYQNGNKEKYIKNQKSFIGSVYHNREDLKEAFLKNPRLQIFDQVSVQYQKINEQNESQDLNPFGLWKIEALDVQKGGELRWDQCYRLKHVISGNYLFVDENQQMGLMELNYVQLELIEFRFVAIDNLIQYKSRNQSTQKISKDAFFWIQHKKTSLQIGFEDIENELVPKLYNYTKDINTFRFKEATYESVWENYSINAGQNILLQQVSYCQNTIQMSQMSVLKKEMVEGKQKFDQNFDQVLKVLDFLKEFLTNSQIANMNLDEEPIMASRNRQDRFHTQYSLGLLCWMLIEIFPSYEEFEMLQISPDEESIAGMIRSSLKRRKGVKYQKNTSYNFRQAQDHLIKKYIICRSAYQLLATAAIDNPKNQRFILQFIQRLSNHIGFGQFVTEGLVICFKNNKEILEEIHRYHIKPLEPDLKHKYYDIFQALAHRLKLFEPYQKIEILRLLSEFASQGNSSIYINQEKIFHSIVDNKNFLFGHFMKIIENQSHDIVVEYRVFIEKEYESKMLQFEEFFQQSRTNKIVTYLKEQIRLYSQLCQNRNYVCVKNMQELLPQKVLIYYLNSNLDEDIKAILCSMILNLYVDQEPRSIINKPSFVRVFSQQNKRDDITQRFIELNLRDDIKGTYEIRQWLLKYLSEKIQILKSIENNWKVDITSKVYNEYTYEVIRIIAYMIKFGLFTQYANELFAQSMKKDNDNEIEDLINYLAAMLEFDFNYFTELMKNEFKRSYQKVVVESNFLLAGNLMNAGLNIFQQKKQIEEEEEELNQNSNDKDSSKQFIFLKRYSSLFKLIKTFTNKTCRNTIFKVSTQIDYIVLIKKQICLILSDIFDWREDFYIENAIKYFENNEQDKLNTIMPQFSIDPSKYQSKRKTQFENYVGYEEVKDFDLVLQRPFVEVLILAFYFSKDSELQNTLANLIYKRYTQREKLIQNLTKVSLVQASNDSYHRLSALVNDIKNLISYSQQWLQIIESSVYDEKAEETLSLTSKKFKELCNFWYEESDPEGFLIKQKVFRHLGGHKLILKFIESGIRVINQKIAYFQNEQESEYSYKNDFIQNVLLVFQLSHKILSKFVELNQSNQNNVYKKYTQFVDKPVKVNIGQVEFLQSLFLGNSELCQKQQAIYFKFVVQLIKDHGHYQEFLQILQIFLECSQSTDNSDIQKAIINCLLNNYKFVDPFLTLELANSHLPYFYTTDKNPNPVQTIQNEVHPKPNEVYHRKPNEAHFKQSLLQIISTSLQSDLSVNYIVMMHNNLTVHHLLILLQKDLGLSTKLHIYAILEIYFDNIDSSIQELQVNCEEFAKLLKISVDKMRHRLNEDEQIFLGQCIIGLVNLYFENFLKDIGMIALKMLANDEGIQKEKFIFDFAQIFVDNLDKMHKEDKLIYSNIVQLSKNFSIEVPEKYLQDESGMKQKFMMVKNALKFTQSKVEKRKSEYLIKWGEFVELIQTDVSVKKGLKEEKMKFPQVILNIQDIFEKPSESIDIRLRELIISKDDIITTLLQYIQYWKKRQANKNTIIFIIKSIRALLQCDSESERTKRQNHLDSLNATSIALKLYWKDRQTDDQYIYQLIKWIIGMLQGGNKTIQMSILNLMLTQSDSQAFFSKIYVVLTEYMQKMRKSTVVGRIKQIEKTLQVIQLLCEGHNTSLQNYLRQQTNSKISYDIVSLMVKLVISNKISDGTYASLLQCLETLTEVVQGPCKENQVVIVTSKFVQWGIDLLKEEPKLFLFKEEQGVEVMQIKRVLLNRLKYKCSVTLLSLMEMQEANDEIMNLMVRSIPCIVLVTELGKFYSNYKSIYGKEYILSAFRSYENQNLFERKNECIIEYGFNLFTLINMLMLRNTKSQEAELDEIHKLLDNYQFVKKKTIDFDIDIFNVIDLSGMLSQGLGALKQLGGGDDDEESQELKREAENRNLQKEAFTFFSQNTVFIEILRDEELQRIYFPLLPQCKMLPKESKMEFHEIVDHSSIRDKLVTLMNEANHMRKIMEHEELLRNIFKRIKVVELIATHKTLWENMAFLTNVILNFMIIVSFSSYAYTDSLPSPPQSDFNSMSTNPNLDWLRNVDIANQESQHNWDSLKYARLYEPRLFFKNEYDWTNIAIMIVGYINLGFSLLVITFFAIKKAPLLITDLWIEFLSQKMGYFQRFIQSIVMIVKSFIKCLVDFDFAYYCGYMACIILGLVVHPFVFVFLMADFLRIATLKIVIKAIWISKTQMGLSFLVFLLVEYYFSILSYIYFHDQYDNNSCEQMWRCFLQTFDQTFKNGGALGDYLKNNKIIDSEGNTLPFNYQLDLDQQYSYFYRFIYDVLFKFILVILIINMVAGIIIDTFGALKDDMLEKKSFLEDYCFICGIDSEKLDKSTQYGKYSHIKKNHYMWNYVFYKVFLFFKPKADLSGNETYVKRLMILNDIDWFPIKQAMNFQDEDDDDEEEEEDSSNLPIVESTLEEVQQLELMATQTNLRVKNFLFEKYNQ